MIIQFILGYLLQILAAIAPEFAYNLGVWLTGGG